MRGVARELSLPDLLPKLQLSSKVQFLGLPSESPINLPLSNAMIQDDLIRRTADEVAGVLTKLQNLVMRLLMLSHIRGVIHILIQATQLAVTYQPQLAEVSVVLQGSQNVARGMKDVQIKARSYQWNGK